MLWLKLVGVAMLIGGGGLAAMALNKRCENAVKLCDEWVSFVRYVKNQVECFSLPFEEILRRRGEQLCKCGICGVDIPKNPSELLSRGFFGDKRTAELVRDLFSDFGKYYRDEQVKRCEICLSMLEEHAEKIRDELKSKKKLNTTLIMSACIALAILLL